MISHVELSAPWPFEVCGVTLDKSKLGHEYDKPSRFRIICGF